MKPGYIGKQRPTQREVDALKAEIARLQAALAVSINMVRAARDERRIDAKGQLADD